MAKFYVVGITKYDSSSTLYDVALKLEDASTGIEGDMRIQIDEEKLSEWVPRIGKYSDEFVIVFE